MKKTLYVFAWACLSLLALPAAAQVPAYVPTDGLVGWWPFNGNANDESGNGNDGTVNGATLTEDRFGNVNSAYYFNGQSDNISVPHSNSIAITNDLTISVWKNSSGNTGGYETFVNKRGGNGEWNYSLGASHTFGPGGCPQEVNKYLTGRRNNAGAQYELRFSDYLVSDDVNQWTNVVLVIMNNTVHFYINGDLAGSSCFGNNFSIPSIDVQAPLTMGSCNCGLPEFFHGIMDDIAIYNRALTEQEIQALYTGQCPTVASNCTSLPSNLQQGLVGYWPFCGNANDESGNGNDGTVNGAMLTEDRFGNANAAYDFDGVDDFIVVQDDSSLRPDHISLMVWLKTSMIEPPTTALGEQSILIYKGDFDNASNEQYALDTDYSFGIKSESNCISGQGWNLVNSENNSIINEWHQFIGVFNGAVLKMYIDSELIDSIDYTGTIDDCAGGELYFGQSWSSFPLNFNGALDDIGIWNRALTPEEVQELYTLDACTFTVYDTSYVTIYDTLTTYETVYDTLYTYETIYDTVTTYVTVTDTLLIDITFVGLEGQPSWLNTVTVFPNPASDHITIDYGNFALMAGYNTVITDAAGATVYSSAVNSQQAYIDINAWGVAGVYYLSIYDANGALVAVRHIVLE